MSEAWEGLDADTLDELIDEGLRTVITGPAHGTLLDPSGIDPAHPEYRIRCVSYAIACRMPLGDSNGSFRRDFWLQPDRPWNRDKYPGPDLHALHFGLAYRTSSAHPLFFARFTQYLEAQKAFHRIIALSEMMLAGIAASGAVEDWDRAELEVPLRFSFFLGVGVALLDQLGEVPPDMFAPVSEPVIEGSSRDAPISDDSLRRIGTLIRDDVTRLPGEEVPVQGARASTPQEPQDMVTRSADGALVCHGWPTSPHDPTSMTLADVGYRCQECGRVERR